MLKNKFKIMFLLVAIVALISTYCFATDTAGVSMDELLESAATEDGETPIVISGEDADSEATEDYEDDDLTTGQIDQSDWVNSDLYKIGDKVTIDKVVDGNVFVIANEVTITSEIGGDAFIIAKKVTLDGGYIYSSLFVAANEVVINGIVYDVYGVSSNFTLGSDGYIYRDLRLASNSINLNGKIRRDAYLTGVSFNFNVDNGTIIGGNLTYKTAENVDIPDGAVNGDVMHDATEVKEVSVAERVTSYIMDAINLLVLTFVVILLAVWLAPNFVERVSTMSTKKAFASLGIGFVAPILAILVILLLLISGICSTLGVVATLLFVAVCMCGTAFASIFLGSKFAKLVKWEGKVKFVIASLISALIVWIISKIPFIGGFVGFLVAVFGIGTLLVNVFYRKTAKKEPAEKEATNVKE